MKINKCYVSSFGAIKNKEFDFSQNLTTILEENGWGKSTLASFIKCVFYGLSDSKKSIEENERLKFKPWNSIEKFGGYIEFTWGEKKFKLERFFGNKSSEDTVKLTDLETGKTYVDTTNWGDRIFQIDEEGFLSTTFLSQKEMTVKSSPSITAKFNSVFEVDDSQDFDKVIKKLEENIKLYKYRGDKGLISDTKNQIFVVSEEIEKANLAGKTADSLVLGVNLLEKEVEELNKQSSLLAEKVALAGEVQAVLVKKQQYKEVENKKLDLANKKASLLELFNGENVSEQQIADYLACEKELNNIEIREKILIDDVNNLRSQPQQKAKSNKNVFFGAFIGLGALCIATLLALCFIFGVQYLTSIPSIVLICLSLGFFACSLFAKKSFNKYANSENKQKEQFIDSKIAEINDFNNIKEQYKLKISSFLSKFSFRTHLSEFDALTLLLEKVKELKILDEEILETEKRLEFLKQDGALREINEQDNLVELKQKLHAVQIEYTRKANELAKKKSDVKYYRDRADLKTDLEDRKNDLVQKLEDYKNQHEILTKTLEYLKTADTNLKIKYRAPLQESLNKYLSYISNNKKTAKIDIDLNVNIEENGSDFAVAYYSKGYRNLFEICKRFALVDVLFTGEKPFIILDDPFYNLDDEKLSLSLDLIRKLSNEYQIIYFACHESRRA